ncbi:hypothetical protein NVP1170O_031 [Vibrio phage 1.170.O._10N.261.52.C3]|nr:hypothetical protein NVP1170O_031 [Vibrio phage 1.170.O._10N.261.52.C3]
MNREIKTDLYNILSHVTCAEDYGYYDDVLMSDLASLTGWVFDEEIDAYINDNLKPPYTQADGFEWRYRINNWRSKYCEK